nr:NrsF family protein [Chthonobacter rhizosphaerae]
MIASLTADAKRSARRPAPTILPAALAGTLLAVVVFAVLVGKIRPDIAGAVGEIRFLLKFAVTLSLAGAAYAVLRESAYPEGVHRRRLLVLAVPAVVVLSCVAFELAALPADAVTRSLVGSNSVACLVNVSLMGIGPLGLFVLALRRAAPAHPALSGIAAGLLAGAIAATVYAAYCPDDSPLFVATWYLLAIGGLAALGAATARVVARW